MECTNESEQVNCGWYLFYNWPGEPEIETIRIAASCLGNALITAKELSVRSNIYIIGVCKELGVRDQKVIVQGSAPTIVIGGKAKC